MSPPCSAGSPSSRPNSPRANKHSQTIFSESHPTGVAFLIPENRKGKGMVYLHNFYLNPMFDPSGPRPGADAHNCTVGYVSEYKPPSLYPGVNLVSVQ
nr:MAG TPA: hypothetical protein [Caudoviricetes sp.]DAH72387.1 MAG TPA: hypothetical protein [Caudoviricetes sp.]